jgi:DNA-binding LacI/PurR family transcriptional regulator
MLLSRAERPNAVFCVTDLLALGFMDVARHTFAVGIPEELCVIGFDDIPEAGWDSYQLTTFRQPVEEISDWVVGVIDSKQRGAAASTAVLNADPVWRQSVRPR